MNLVDYIVPLTLELVDLPQYGSWVFQVDSQFQRLKEKRLGKYNESIYKIYHNAVN